MLTQQQIITILQQGNTVSFDGTTYTITDVNNNVSTFTAADLQASINSFATSLSTSQENVTNEQNTQITLNAIVTALVSFQANNTSQTPRLEPPVQFNQIKPS
jgi:hypothetical protein